MMAENLFKNRSEAGKKLGRSLSRFRKENPIVIAIPRGGVVIGAQVAQALHTPLEILVVRKIGSPGNPEFGIGAVTENRVTWINQNNVNLLGLNSQEINELIEYEYKEVEKRVLLFRHGLPPPRVSGRTVIVVDDGLATGVTTTAAIDWLKMNKAKKIILAFPVCAPSTALELKKLAEEVICLATPLHFYAVGQWFEDFTQVSDQEVVEILEYFRLKTHAA